MIFPTTSAPNPSDLAFQNPDEDMQAHLGAIVEEKDYWTGRRAEAEGNVDLGIHAMAGKLVTWLDGAKLALDTSPEIPVSIKAPNHTLREIALGTLATARLFRRLVDAQDPVEIEDARAYGIGNIAPEMPFQQGRVLPPRIYLTREALDIVVEPSQKEDQWYLDNGIYVRRELPPAQPSDHLRLFFQEHEYFTPFDQMSTLHPTLQSILANK